MTNKEHNKITEQELEAESFIHTLRQVSLTKTEAQDMRDRLVAYTDMHAVNASRTAAAPAALRGPLHVLSPLSSYFSSYPRKSVAAVLILIILISGTGVSYADESSLPGQPFYTVKVSVVEPIEGALITNPVAKAKWQDELVSRRLTEAATLAAQNNLATSTQEYLAQAIAEHVALAQQDDTQLSLSGNAAAALSVESDLEAKLTAHADFLSLVTPRLKATGDATTTVIAVSSMLRAVTLQENNVEMSRQATELALGVTPSANSTTETASSTSAHAEVVAYVNSQNSEIQTEETSILKANSALFRLLPSPSMLSSTTASTTEASSTSVETVATTTIQTSSSGVETVPSIIQAAPSTNSVTPSPQKLPFYNLNIGL